MLSLIVGCLVTATIPLAILWIERRAARAKALRRELAEIAEHNRLSRLEWEARQKRINSCC